MTSTVAPRLSMSAPLGHGMAATRRTPVPAVAASGLARVAAALQQAWTAYQLHAQARSLIRRAEQFEATQPSYAADLRAAAAAVRGAGGQVG